MKILIAEEDSLILKTSTVKLQREGFQVTGCSDGQQAIETIRNEHPDIVLTNIMMPHSSGLEIITAVKSLPGKPIPVIVFSVLGREDTVEEALRLGADDYITKPFSLAELAIRVKKQLKLL